MVSCELDNLRVLVFQFRIDPRVHGAMDQSIWDVGPVGTASKDEWLGLVLSLGLVVLSYGSPYQDHGQLLSQSFFCIYEASAWDIKKSIATTP